MKPETPTSAPSSRPRARRLVGAVVAGVLAVSVLAGCLSEDQTTVQAQINYSRAVYGAHALADYGPADTKAQNWANYLASIGTIKHSTLTDGYAAGTWCRLGENVGMGPSLLAINTAFLNSPSHRANMLSPYYDHFGTGVAKRGNTYFVVQEFVDLC
jgi:uncharacterized protein YkwD